MNKSFYWEFLKDFVLKVAMPVFAIVGFFLTIYLPVSFALRSPEPSQTECHVIASAGNQFDIRCTTPEKESSTSKISPAMRHAYHKGETE
jgi:hypothetical protein|nr:MAG TPA: hypothetical protein [Caudoviricetes sp.]